MTDHITTSINREAAHHLRKAADVLDEMPYNQWRERDALKGIHRAQGLMEAANIMSVRNQDQKNLPNT